MEVPGRRAAGNYRDGKRSRSRASLGTCSGTSATRWRSSVSRRRQPEPTSSPRRRPGSRACSVARRTFGSCRIATPTRSRPSGLGNRPYSRSDQGRRALRTGTARPLVNLLRAYSRLSPWRTPSGNLARFGGWQQCSPATPALARLLPARTSEHIDALIGPRQAAALDRTEQSQLLLPGLGEMSHTAVNRDCSFFPTSGRSPSTRATAFARWPV